jgi:hypothetical protein
LLKDLDSQATAQDLVRRSVPRTLEALHIHIKNVLKKRFVDQLEANRQTIRNYEESIAELKRYEVHSAFRKDGKQYLMDFYYDEAQMNKWRDSCKRSEESLRGKFDKFEKDVTNAKMRYGNSAIISNSNGSDEMKCKEILKRLEHVMSEKEPLIISIISTVYEDLKDIHRYLGVFCAVDPKSDEIKQA